MRAIQLLPLYRTVFAYAIVSGLYSVHNAVLIIFQFCNVLLHDLKVLLPQIYVFINVTPKMFNCTYFSSVFELTWWLHC
jgi:hypothetical protein